MLPNPSAGLSAAALQKLYQQNMRMFTLIEQLADMVNNIDSSLNRYAKDTTSTEAGVSQNAKAKVAALDSFKKELLELNRKSIFFDEVKFRRKLTDFYLDLVTALEPLSPNQEKAIDLLETEFKQYQQRLKSIF